MEIEDNSKLEVSDIEFNMPQPSYTIDTGSFNRKASEKSIFTNNGSDNLHNFHKWKNYKQILENYSIHVFPRPGFEISILHKNIHVVNGSKYGDLRFFIRESIKNGKTCLI